MFQGLDKRDLMLIYAVIGFGSVALVALGELSGVKEGGSLYTFYLKLVFGGFLVFYAVLFHFAQLALAKKIDKTKGTVLRFLLGEKSSRTFINVIIIGVLLYWVLAFADLMSLTGFNFFG